MVVCWLAVSVVIFSIQQKLVVSYLTFRVSLLSGLETIVSPGDREQMMVGVLISRVSKPLWKFARLCLAYSAAAMVSSAWSARLIFSSQLL